MRRKQRVGRPVDQRKDEAIRAAAYALVFKKGPAGVSVEAVARRAGVSKATVYARYANREALIEAVIRQQAERLSASLSLVPSRQLNLRSSLMTFGVNLLAFLLSDTHLEFMRALRGMTKFHAIAMQTIFRNGPQATLDELVKWMKSAHRAKLANFSQPKRSAELFLGMLMGLDIVRSMYGVPCNQNNLRIKRHVAWVVEGFMKLHEVI